MLRSRRADRMQSFSQIVFAREAQNIVLLKPCHVVQGVVAHMRALIGAFDKEVLTVYLASFSLLAPIFDTENGALKGPLLLS